MVRLGRLAAVLILGAAAACGAAHRASAAEANQVALFESPEITLSVRNDEDGALQIVAPGGRTVDVLAGESVEIVMVVVVLAELERPIFRPWYRPGRPTPGRLAEVVEPHLLRTDGLMAELRLRRTGGWLATVRLSADGCPGAGWHAPDAGPATFAIAASAPPNAVLRLCPP